MKYSHESLRPMHLLKVWKNIFITVVIAFPMVTKNYFPVLVIQSTKSIKFVDAFKLAIDVSELTMDKKNVSIHQVIYSSSVSLTVKFR